MELHFKHLYLISAALLLLCLFSMPYGYYVLVRYTCMVSFGVLAFRSFQEEKTGWAVTFVSLAVLFQPFVKIHLGKTMWNVVDIAVATLMIGLFVFERKRLNK